MVGVGHNRNTFLHGVEELLDTPNRLTPKECPLSIRHPNGKTQSRPSKCHLAVGIGDVSARYPKYEPAFRYHGHIRDGFIGNAPTQLCDAIGMSRVLTLINERSGGIELMTDDSPIPAEYYKNR